MTKRLFVAAAVFLSVVTTPSYAQRAIGVEWKVPANPGAAQNDLSQFRAWGITYLQVNGVPHRDTWKLISEAGFKVYAMLPIPFPTLQTFSDHDSTLKQKADIYLKNDLPPKSIKALGLFSYGAFGNSKFLNRASTFSKYVKTRFAGPLYYQSAQDSLATHPHIADFEMLTITGKKIPKRPFIKAYLYEPADSVRWKLAPVKYFLEHTPQNNTIPVFFHADWLQKMLKKYPQFKPTLQLYASSDNPVFPLPAQTKSVSAHSLIIIPLLLAWLLFALTYYQSPVFKKAFLRYFMGHTFFVDDVMERHIRTPVPGFSILIQQALLSGICGYCIGHTLFSLLGQHALAAHYPLLAFAGLPFGFFFWGAGLTLLFEIICVCWLLFANPVIKHFGQILNLYPWPLQLNLFVGTLLTLCCITKKPAYLVLVLAFVFVLLSGSAFIITSFDSTRRLTANRKWYLLGTTGLYVLLIAASILWIINSQELIQVLKLAASFP